jgi:hypothetical protein
MYYTAIGTIIGALLGIIVNHPDIEDENPNLPIRINLIFGVLSGFFGGVRGFAIDVNYNIPKVVPKTTIKSLDSYTSFEDFNRDFQDVALISFETNDTPYYKNFAFKDQLSFENFKNSVESFNEALKIGEINLTCPERAIPGYYEYNLMTNIGRCGYGTPEGFPGFPGLKICPEGSHIDFKLGHFSCWFDRDFPN